MAKTVLVTGASGFIATHTIDALLRKGYNVRGTVRSERSAADVRKTHAKYADQLTLAIVPDISAPNTFDEAVKGVDGVCAFHDVTFLTKTRRRSILTCTRYIHQASPFILNATDFEKELLEPAINGITTILESAQKYSPDVSRVVVTSSFASVLDPNLGMRPGYT